MLDHWAYRKGTAQNYGAEIPFEVPQNKINAQKVLRGHRVIDYNNECKANIIERISKGEPTKSYATYLNSKQFAKSKVKKILSDIKEIKASL